MQIEYTPAAEKAKKSFIDHVKWPVTVLLISLILGALLIYKLDFEHREPTLKATTKEGTVIEFTIPQVRDTLASSIQRNKDVVQLLSDYYTNYASNMNDDEKSFIKDIIAKLQEDQSRKQKLLLGLVDFWGQGKEKQELLMQEIGEYFAGDPDYVLNQGITEVKEIFAKAGKNDTQTVDLQYKLTQIQLELDQTKQLLAAEKKKNKILQAENDLLKEHIYQLTGDSIKLDSMKSALVADNLVLDTEKKQAEKINQKLKEKVDSTEEYKVYNYTFNSPGNRQVGNKVRLIDVKQDGIRLTFTIASTDIRNENSKSTPITATVLFKVPVITGSKKTYENIYKTDSKQLGEIFTFEIDKSDISSAGGHFITGEISCDVTFIGKKEKFPQKPKIVIVNSLL